MTLQAYTYDGFGNVATRDPDVETAGLEVYVYDPLRPHVALGIGPSATAEFDRSFSHDSAGRRASDTGAAVGDRSYHYSAAGFLVDVCRAADCGSRNSDVVQHNVYDEGGVRVATSEASTSRVVHYFGNFEIENNEILRHFFLGGQRVAMDRIPAPWRLETMRYPVASGAYADLGDDTLRYFHADHLGSPQVLSNDSAEVTQHIRYGAYGDVIGIFDGGGNYLGTTGGETTRTFTDHERHDETGLIFMGARFFEAETGLFLSRDPAGQYNSPYIYGGFSPFMGVDPDGQSYMEVFENYGVDTRGNYDSGEVERVSAERGAAHGQWGGLGKPTMGEQIRSAVDEFDTLKAQLPPVDNPTSVVGGTATAAVGPLQGGVNAGLFLSGNEEHGVAAGVTVSGLNGLRIIPEIASVSAAITVGFFTDGGAEILGGNSHEVSLTGEMPSMYNLFGGFYMSPGLVYPGRAGQFPDAAPIGVTLDFGMTATTKSFRSPVDGQVTNFRTVIAGFRSGEQFTCRSRCSVLPLGRQRVQ